MTGPAAKENDAMSNESRTDVQRVEGTLTSVPEQTRPGPVDGESAPYPNAADGTIEA